MSIKLQQMVSLKKPYCLDKIMYLKPKIIINFKICLEFKTHVLVFSTSVKYILIYLNQIDIPTKKILILGNIESINTDFDY
jgi:hypothetical protein